MIMLNRNAVATNLDAARAMLQTLSAERIERVLVHEFPPCATGYRACLFGTAFGGDAAAASRHEDHVFGGALGARSIRGWDSPHARFGHAYEQLVQDEAVAVLSGAPAPARFRRRDSVDRVVYVDDHFFLKLSAPEAGADRRET